VASPAELRTETLVQTGATGSANNVAEFRNDSSVNIAMRDISGIAYANDMVINDETLCELSKAIALTGRTNNQTRWNAKIILIPEAGINTVIVANKGTYHDKWARGQFILEPGESLHVHILFSGGNATTVQMWDLQYEFMG